MNNEQIDDATIPTPKLPCYSCNDWRGLLMELWGMAKDRLPREDYDHMYDELKGRGMIG